MLLPRLRALTAGVLLCLPFAPGVAHAAPELGINFSPSDASDPATMARLQAAGTKWGRFFVNWDAMEPTPGGYDEASLGQYKALGDVAHSRGIKLDLVITRTPSWASGNAGPTSPPLNPQDYANFLAHLAQKMGSSVDALELWNEEDASLWWAGGPDAGKYAAMLKAAYPAIKAVNPGVTVILGGLTGNDWNYLQQLYDDGAKGFFDAVSTHTDTACSVNSPYDYYHDDPSHISQWSFLGYRAVHDVMAANGDDKPIIMTEFGWSSSATTCATGMWAGKKPAGVSENNQALYLKQAYHCASQDPYVRAMLWFTYADFGTTDSMDNRYGLVRASGGGDKPSWSAYQTAGTKGDTLSGDQCGDFSAPVLAVTTPTPNLKFVAELPIKVSASDPSGVTRITLYADGSKIQTFTNQTAPKTLSGQLVWQGAKKLALGAHTLKVEAVDKPGNIATSSIPLSKVTGDQLPPVATTTTLKVGKVKHRTVSVTAKVKPATPQIRVPGKIQLSFEKMVKGHWRPAHKYGHMAKEAFRMTAKLEPAVWRVVATYVPQKPFLASSVRSRRFVVR